MKRRWLLTTWLLALLSFSAWAGTPTANVSSGESCDCCCATQAELSCGCGCEVGPMPMPVSQLGGHERLSEFAPATLLGGFVTQPQRPTTTPVAVVFYARAPRQQSTLAGRADWRGPPALV